VLEELVDGVLSKSYTLGLDVIGQALAASGAVHFFLYDGHGSTRGLVDATGQPLSDQIYRYDAYGNAIGFDPAAALTTLLYSGEQLDAAARGGYLGKSADIYLSTSADGVDWKPPQLLTPNPGNRETDTIPSLIEGPDGEFCAVWITTQLSRGPTVVGGPVWPKQKRSDLRRLPAEGYSVRGQVLPDGRYLLAWVKTVSGTNHDSFYRILDGFDFGGFERVSP
jgi:hypothetical protein